MNLSKKGHSSLPSVRRSMPPAARDSAEEKKTPARCIKGIAFGLITYLVLGMMLTLAATAIAIVSADPSALVLPLSVGAQLAAAFVGGLVSVKTAGGRPLICGIIFGAAVMIISLFLSLLLPEALGSGLSFIKSVGLHIPAFLSGLLGGAAGNIKKRSHRGRRYGYR